MDVGRAEIDRAATHVDCVDAAADAIRPRLQHLWSQPTVAQQTRGGEACRAGAHDNDPGVASHLREVLVLVGQPAFWAWHPARHTTPADAVHAARHGRAEAQPEVIARSA